MKKLFLFILLIVFVTTPCFAQKLGDFDASGPAGVAGSYVIADENDEYRRVKNHEDSVLSGAPIPARPNDKIQYANEILEKDFEQKQKEFKEAERARKKAEKEALAKEKEEAKEAQEAENKPLGRKVTKTEDEEETDKKGVKSKSSQSKEDEDKDVKGKKKKSKKKKDSKEEEDLKDGDDKDTEGKKASEDGEDDEEKEAEDEEGSVVCRKYEKCELCPKAKAYWSGEKCVSKTFAVRMQKKDKKNEKKKSK